MTDNSKNQEFYDLISTAKNFYNKKQYIEAERYYKKAIRLNKNFSSKALYFSDVFNALSLSLIRQEKYNSAKRYLEKALKIEPDDDTYLYNIAYCLFELGCYGRALSYLGQIKLRFRYMDRASALLKVTSQAFFYKNMIKKAKNEITVSSLCDYINTINKIREAKMNTTYIFRGQHNHFYPLKPSLYRDEEQSLYIRNNESYYKKLEKNITKEFSLKADGYFNHEMAHFDKVDKLALMQHHGVPTRLLDFTESPLIALYFAIKDINDDNYYSEAPCVYVLNIEVFDCNEDGRILSSEQVKIKDEDSDDETFNSEYRECKFAFSPKLKNKRLTAQKGIFIAFDKNEPLELCTMDYLTKIIIPRQKISKIKQELENMGITPTTIYPDFEGLSKEVRTPRNFAPTKKISKTKEKEPEIL